ncbi:hypothetical protein [uncultured Novosphingobium sp.]|uniref:hypothetical protein n=1 Tax=uncultured Novosphingobium sp. TaxID=292277 RepID=UPI003749352A
MSSSATACCFVDLGVVAARWNVEHAHESGGKGAALDLCYLSQLGSSAVLPLLAIESRHDLPLRFRDRVQSVRMQAYDALLHHENSEGGLLDTWRLRQAAKILERVRPVALPPGYRDCDGNLLPPPPKLAPMLAPTPTAQAEPSPTLTGASRK